MLNNFKTYQMALSLYDNCQRIKAPAYIRDQLNRASLSVVLNIAEGSAKAAEKERKRFYQISYASVREVQALLTILKKEDLFKLADSIGGCLYRLHR